MNEERGPDGGRAEAVASLFKETRKTDEDLGARVSLPLRGGGGSAGGQTAGSYQ